MAFSRSFLLLFTTTLLTCCIVGDSFAIHFHNESFALFANNSEATLYAGPKLQVRFESTPSSFNDYWSLDALKVVVHRLHDHVIDFELVDQVLPGHFSTPGCRPSDNTEPHQLSLPCKRGCMSNGRYCNYHSFFPRGVNPDLAHVLGSALVEESARRTCIFQQLGPKAFFQYIDAMHATGCDTQYQEWCITRSFHMIRDTLDVQTLNSCMGAMSPTLDFDNPILETLEQEEYVPKARFPKIMVNGAVQVMDVMRDTDADAAWAIQLICNSIPEGFEKPKICPFCTEFCPSLHKHTNLMQCLWELKCNDVSKTSFTDYLLHLSESDAVADEPDDDAQGNIEVEEATITPEDYEAGSSGQPQEQSGSSGQPQEQSDEGLFVVAIFFITALGFAVASLVIIACLRQYRSKMIVDQYLKEQAGLRATTDERGAHWDHGLFPDEVDLDVEPALQYSDHIAASPAQQPPAKNSFLPKIA
jgi:hypothetical protein